MRNLALASILLFAVSISAPPQDSRHPFTFADAATLHRAAPVAISPDGKNILYRVCLAAEGPDKTEWHMIAAAGGDSRPLSIPDEFHPAGFTRDGSALYGTLCSQQNGRSWRLCRCRPQILPPLPPPLPLL